MLPAVTPRDPEGRSSSLETRATTCNRDCPDACRVLADVEDGRVVRLRGDPAHPITQGFLCHRTSRFLATQYAPERLTRPLLRRDGRLEPVGWDEVLDHLAARMTAIRAESGPAAIFHYRSGGTLGLLGSVVDLFFQAFGPVTTKRGDICGGAGDAAQLLDFGASDANDLLDLEHARRVILWGKNVHTSSPHTLPPLRRARAGGAELILVDPVAHRGARLADRHVQLRPGGDLALALGIAHRLEARGAVHPEARRWAHGVDAFLGLARSRSAADWGRLADVDPDALEALCDAFVDGPTTVLVGWGMQRRVNGASIVRALDALGVLSGNVGVPGAGVSYYWKRRGAFDTGFLDVAPPRTISEPRFGAELLATDASETPVRMVWITAGNPVAMLPDSDAVARALESRELVVVVDSQLTDTAERAHVVLPTTTLLEADDVLGAYGHHWIGVAEPVVPPPPEVRSDLQIVQGLAARLGLSEVVAGDASVWKARLISPAARTAGVGLEALRAGGLRNPLAAPVAFEGRVFAHPDGRARLMEALPPAAAAHLDALAEQVGVDAPRAEAPADASAADARATVLEPGLYLMSLSTPRSQSAQWVEVPEGPLEATVHPEAAAGLADGALARLVSPLAALTVRLRHDASQRRDLVLVPKGGHLREGHAANQLTTARLTDAGEGGALYDQKVRLEPA
jgi:anaerobic selenocysteine-containing dehydrogenase